MNIGVDEAGRGPVIGPLVVCAFASTSQSQLRELGVKDSKDLSKKKREELFEILKEMPHNVVVCSPERIDVSENLNNLETFFANLSAFTSQASSIISPSGMMDNASANSSTSRLFRLSDKSILSGLQTTTL